MFVRKRNFELSSTTQKARRKRGRRKKKKKTTDRSGSRSGRAEVNFSPREKRKKGGVILSVIDSYLPAIQQEEETAVLLGKGGVARETWKKWGTRC